VSDQIADDALVEKMLRKMTESVTDVMMTCMKRAPYAWARACWFLYSPCSYQMSWLDSFGHY
jgi:hypothetical protein